jgi:hypothetical protein
MTTPVPSTPTLPSGFVNVNKDALKQALVDLRDLFANPVTPQGEPLPVAGSAQVETGTVKGFYGDEKYKISDLKEKLKMQATLKWEDSAANYAKRMVSSKANLKGLYRNAKYDNTGKLMNPEEITLADIEKERDGAIRDRDWYKVGDQPRGYYPFLTNEDKSTGKFVPPRLQVPIPTDAAGNPQSSAVLLELNPNLNSKYPYLSEDSRKEYYAIEDEQAILRLARLKYKLAEQDHFYFSSKKKREDFKNIYREMQIPNTIPTLPEVNQARDEYYWDINQRGNLMYFSGYYHEYVRNENGKLKYEDGYKSSIFAERFLPKNYPPQTTVGAAPTAPKGRRMKSRRNANYRNIRSTRKARK